MAFSTSHGPLSAVTACPCRLTGQLRPARWLQPGADHFGLNEHGRPPVPPIVPSRLQPPKDSRIRLQSAIIDSESAVSESQSQRVTDGSPVILSGGCINCRTKTVSPHLDRLRSNLKRHSSCTVPSTEPLRLLHQPIADNDVPRPPGTAPLRQGA